MAYGYEDEEIIETPAKKEKLKNIDLDTSIDEEKEKDVIIVDNVSKARPNDKFITDNLLMGDPDAVKEQKQESMSSSELLSPELKKIKTINYELGPDDEKYFMEYIGKNYRHLVRNRFNICAFLFGGAYQIYRKMYLLGLCWLFSDALLFILFPKINVNHLIIALLFLISRVACGIVTNHTYLLIVARDVVLCKNNYLGKNIMDMCRRMGRTNIMFATIAYLIVGIIFTNYFTVYLSEGINELLFTPAPVVKQKFDGVFNYNLNISINNYLSLSVPDNFRNDSQDNYRYYYTYGANENNQALCSVELFGVKDYDNEDDVMKDIIEYADTSDYVIEDYSVNSLNWKRLLTEMGMKNIYFHTTKKEDKVYVLKYTYLYNAESECMQYYEDIMKSIE